MTYRGDILGRFDPHYYLPFFRETIDILAQSRFQIVKLKEVCWKITDGTHHTPEYIDYGVPFLSVKDVRENAVNFNDTKFISEVEHSILSRRCKPEPNDVLLTKIGTFGLAAVVPENVPEFSLFVSVALLKIIKTRANPYYVAYCLNTQYSRIQMNRLLKGIAQPDLHLEEIAKISILLPPLETQNYIVKIIQSAHAQKRQKEQEADAVLDSIDDYVLTELGIEMPVIEEKKCFVVYAGDVEGRVDPSAYRSLKTSSIDAIKSSKYKSVHLKDIVAFRKEIVTDSFELLYVGLENIESNTGFYVPSTEEKESFNSALKFESGDVLFPKLRPYLNKVHFAEFNGVCSTEFHVLKGKNLNNLYLFAFLRSKLVVNQTTCLMTGNTLPRLQTQDIQRLPILFPPFDVQEKIADEVVRRQSEAAKLRQEAVAKWEAAKAQFEAQLLSGEVS